MKAPSVQTPSLGRLLVGVFLAPLSLPLPIALVTLLFPQFTVRPEAAHTPVGETVIFILGFLLVGFLLAYTLSVIVVLPAILFVSRRQMRLSITLIASIAVGVGFLSPLILTGTVALLSPQRGWEWSACVSELFFTVPCSITMALVFWLVAIKTAPGLTAPHNAA